MKKILYSILIAGSVGGLAFGATQAFFSDRETSTGNTFRAGKVDLTIDSTAHYDGMVCRLGDYDQDPLNPETYAWVDEDGNPDNNPRPELLDLPCEGTWPVGNLISEKFWNLSDIKPGDWGENTISVHVENNPVWACIDINNMVNAENVIVDPESEAGDVTTPEGELAQNLFFTAWSDDGDNVWEDGEPLLFSNVLGPASDVLNGRTYTLVDSGSLLPTPMPGGSTSNIGLAWCAGTMTVDPGPNTITCDGSSMGNNTQTDSLTADVTFRVEQSRNNPNFRCVPIEPTATPTPPEPTPTPTS